MQVQSLWPPKGNSLHKNTSYNIYNPFFAQLTLLPNPQNPMLYNWPDTIKMPLPSGNLHSHIIHVPWTHPIQHSKLHLGQFSRYCTAHSRESLYFTMFVKTWLTTTTTSTVLRPFVRDYPGEPVLEETLTHPPSWSSSSLYQLLPPTMIK